MELLSHFILLFFFIIDNAAAYTSSETMELMGKSSNGRFSYLKQIEEDLLHQDWKKQEEPCLRQLLKVVKNVQNSTLWATWIWDSMQFPVGQLYGTRTHLGNYDQCMNLPWMDHPEFRTQYCLAEVTLSDLDPKVTDIDLLGSVEKYMQYKTQHNLRFNSLIWGICVPVACKPESIAKFSGAMLKSTHFGQMKISVNTTVNSEYCQVSGETEENGFRENFMLILIIFLLIISLLSTFYVSAKGAESKSTVLDIAKAFNIKSNAEYLIKTEDQSIGTVLGIRMYSTSLVLLSHQWFCNNVFGLSNSVEIDKILDDFIKCIRFNPDMIIDVFSMLSGLLLTKSILGKKIKSFNIFTVIIMRYIRLICAILLIILLLPSYLLRGDPGPLVKKILQREVDACAKNWWKTVLMIGNYGDTENMCYPILWSLACDFQLFIVGILIFWIYLKRRKVGITLYILCTVASVVLPALHGYIHHTSPVIILDFRTSDNWRKYIVGEPAYINTHLRAGPFFVGLAIGYLMVMFDRTKHKHILSKKTSLIAFAILFVMFLFLILLGGIYHVRKYGPLEGALISVMRRNMAAMIVGFLIIVCEYGNVPSVRNVLSWPGLVPFNKLSFGVYLTHYMIMLRFMMRSRVPFRSDITYSVYMMCALLVASTTMSLLMWLFWEAPMISLFKMVFKRFIGDMQQKLQNKTSDGKNEANLFKEDVVTDNSLEKKIN